MCFSNNLRNDLQHPNEYIRGCTLRFLTKIKDVEILESLIPAINANLEHRCVRACVCVCVCVCVSVCVCQPVVDQQQQKQQCVLLLVRDAFFLISDVVLFTFFLLVLRLSFYLHSRINVR